MEKITKQVVERALAGSNLIAYENKMNGDKGVYRKDIGPAHSFRKLAKTWREVYISLQTK